VPKTGEATVASMGAAGAAEGCAAKAAKRYRPYHVPGGPTDRTAIPY